MIGSTRQQQTSADSARTPYASPQPAQRAGARDAAGRAQPLVPFVPREYRDNMRLNAAVVAGAKVPELPFITPTPVSTQASAAEVALFGAQPDASAPFDAADDLARNFSGIPLAESSEIPEGVYDAAGYDAADHVIADSDASNESVIDEAGAYTPQADIDLPWIDAFAVDGEEAEETWPMGEAGRRLDELTESLSSLDASRSRQSRASEEPVTPVDASEISADASANLKDVDGAAGVSNTQPLPMWNEDEWIDIMPTSMHDMPMHDMPMHDMSAHEASTQDTDVPTASSFSDSDGESSHAASADIARKLFDESAFNSARGDVAPPNPGAAVTAKALESLAQRIRAGELPVPEVQSDMTEEAVLAGVLASMLGWRP